MLISNGIKPYISNINPTKDGAVSDRRSISISLVIDRHHLQIHGPYAPSERDQKRTFWKRWRSTVKKADTCQHIIFGDLNIAPDPVKDRSSQTTNGAGSADKFLSMLQQGLMHDAFRVKHPSTIKWTYSKNNANKKNKDTTSDETQHQPIKSESRIDLFLVSTGLRKKIEDCDILDQEFRIKSDHAPICMTLQLKTKNETPTQVPNVPTFVKEAIDVRKLREKTFAGKLTETYAKDEELADLASIGDVQQRYERLLEILLRRGETVLGKRERRFGRAAEIRATRDTLHEAGTASPTEGQEEQAYCPPKQGAHTKGRENAAIQRTQACHGPRPDRASRSRA